MFQAFSDVNLEIKAHLFRGQTPTTMVDALLLQERNRPD